MRIRPAVKSDYRQLIALFSDFVGDGRYSKPWNDSFAPVLKSRSSFIFVAEDENKLVGFVTFSKRIVVRYPKPIIEIDEMFVAPGYRKRGIGRKLVGVVERKAKSMKCHRIFLESNQKRKVAHKFYASLGYKKDGFYFFKNVSA